MEKKVILKFVTDADGAVPGLNKLTEATKKATDATDQLKKSVSGVGQAGAAGNFFGSAATRDALMLDAMRHKSFAASGLTPQDLTRMSDQQLFDLKKNLPGMTTTRPAPTTLLGKIGAGASAAGGAVAEGVGLGGLGKLGGPAAIAALALTVAPAVAEGIHNANLVADHGGGAGTQARAFANSTLVGRNALGIVDSIAGRRQDIQRAEEAGERAKILAAGEEQVRQNRTEVELSRIAYRARYDVLSTDRRMAGVGTFDRGTVRGETAFRESLATQAARQAEIDAEKNLKARQIEQGGAEQLKGDLERRIGDLRRERAQLMQKTGGGGADDLAALQAAGRKGEQIKQAEEEVKRLEDRIEKGRGDIVQLRAEVGRAKVGGMDARLGLLQQREATAEGQAVRIGYMNPLEYASTKSAFERLSKVGLDRALPGEIDLARSFDAAGVDKLAARRGEAIIRADKLTDLAGSSFRDNLSDVRKESDELRKARTDFVQRLEEGVAKDLTQVLNSEAVIKAQDDRTRRIVREALKQYELKLRESDVKQ